MFICVGSGLNSCSYYLTKSRFQEPTAHELSKPWRTSIITSILGRNHRPNL